MLKIQKTKIIFLLIIFFGFFGLAKSSEAAIYYVATTGDDIAAGDILHPWQTVQKAANTIVAGDTAYVRGGTYNENTITFANSGTSNTNRITVQNYGSESVTIDGGYTVTGGRNPIFYINGRNWITIKGIHLYRGSHSGVYIAYSSACRGITIDSCEIDHWTTGDNSGGIYIDANGASDIIITGNKIHDGVQG